MAATLALLPEGLHAWVNRGDTAAASSPSSSNPDAVELDVRVGGMGCTACTAKVTNPDPSSNLNPSSNPLTCPLP